MQPQEPVNNPSGAGDSGAIACSQCGAPMPREMRFCRACGNRLGEGPAEYTETVRLPNANQTASPFASPYAAPIAQQAGAEVPYKRRRRLSGMTWVLIAIIALFVLGGGLSALRRGVRTSPGFSANFNRTYFGVDGFDNAPDGVTFDNVEPPGGPADKAGLVGGDIVTSFDGHAVPNENEMKSLLRSTPVGKTVEVIYLRDGETKKTQLTTISPSDFGDLESAYSSRPEGRGYFGIVRDRTENIADPQTKTYGVRLDYVERNSPAELFGLEKGDIVTAWDDVPIRTGHELLSRVRRAIPRSTIVVSIIRGGQTMKIPVTMGRG